MRLAMEAGIVAPSSAAGLGDPSGGPEASNSSSSSSRSHHHHQSGGEKRQHRRRRSPSTASSSSTTGAPPDGGGVCAETGARVVLGGPMWNGPLHDQGFVADLIAEVDAGGPSRYPSAPRVRALLPQSAWRARVRATCAAAGAAWAGSAARHACGEGDYYEGLLRLYKDECRVRGRGRREVEVLSFFFRASGDHPPSSLLRLRSTPTTWHTTSPACCA
jgi:hypothetical protein